MGIGTGVIGGGLFIGPTDALVLNNKIVNNKVDGITYAYGAGLCLNLVDDLTVIENNLITQNISIQDNNKGGGIALLFCTNPSARAPSTQAVRLQGERQAQSWRLSG